MTDVECICCGGKADGTYGRGGPPVCFECYETGRLQDCLDTKVKEWLRETGKGDPEHGRYFKAD